MNESAGRDPVFDATKYKLHARTIIGPDGKARTERRPIQKSMRMVDPQGHVCWVPLYAGPAQLAEVDPYRVSIQSAKAKAGWVAYGECPKNQGFSATKNLPESMRDGHPCRIGEKGAPVSDADPCKCVLAIIASRSEENNRKMRALEGSAKTDAQAAADVQTEVLAETRKLNAAIVGVLTGKPEKVGK